MGIDDFTYARVYVLLPVHNRREVTLNFVDCLKEQNFSRVTLVLIDDGSEDGTAEAVAERFGDTIVISGDGNWWWAGSLQQGSNWLRKNKIPRHDVVLIMNDDTSFEPNFISLGMEILKGNPNTMLCASGRDLNTGLPRDSGGYNFQWRSLQLLETHEESEINCLSTRGLMMSVGDFMDVGGFYPKLLPHYLSDLEFTMRAKKLGKRLMLHPDFYLVIDFDKTGIRTLKNLRFLARLKKLFSKRATMNPLFWTTFILLRSPWKNKFRNLWLVWCQPSISYIVSPTLRICRIANTRWPVWRQRIYLHIVGMVKKKYPNLFYFLRWLLRRWS
jgi:GT2 family glycosyltransferase